VFSATPAAPEAPQAKGIAVLWAKGFPALLASPAGAGLLYQVLDSKGKILDSVTLSTCKGDLLAAPKELPKRCIPGDLVEKYKLTQRPGISLICQDLSRSVELLREKRETLVLIQGGEGEAQQHKLPVPRGLSVEVVASWSPTCDLVVTVTVPSLGKAFVVQSPGSGKGTAIKPADRGAFWLRNADRLLDQGDREGALRSAKAAQPLVQGAEATEALTLLLAKAGEPARALKMLAELATLDPEKAKALASKPPLVEARLESLDLADDAWSFKAPAGFEGTSIWLKIKDREGTTVAMFKPSNGNTYHRGEVFTWRMAKLLGLEAMYPVTVLHELDSRGCAKAAAELGKVKYKGLKEKNRRLIIDRCRSGHLEGAVKDWVKDFIFFQGIGKVEKLKRHSIVQTLRIGGPKPEKGKKVPLELSSKLYKPDHCRKAEYRGWLDQNLLARDLSDLLIMDVLNANEDRFPGANLEVRSLKGAKETSKCLLDFGESRLFSLDNGGTFKGGAARSLTDMRDQVKLGRFNRRTFERLTHLAEFIAGERPAPTFLHRQGVTTVEQLTAYLALDKSDNHKRRKVPFAVFRANLDKALEYMERFSSKKGVWF
jgi:hypothetical protein